MKNSYVKAYSFLKYQYLKRADPEPLSILWKVFSDYDTNKEDRRTPHEILTEMSNGRFKYECVWMMQRASISVFQIGEHRTYEHTFNWVQLDGDAWGRRPQGYEACVIDFTKDLSTIYKEIRLLRNRVKIFESGIEVNDICPNAIEHFLCSGLTSCSVSVPRIVGLWLWDKTYGSDLSKKLAKKMAIIEEDHQYNIDKIESENIDKDYLGMPTNLAIKELCRQFDMAKLGLENTEEADFRFYLRKTKECIAEWEVLPFTKRKKGTQKT